MQRLKLKKAKKMWITLCKASIAYSEDPSRLEGGLWFTRNNEVDVKDFAGKGRQKRHK